MTVLASVKAVTAVLGVLVRARGYVVVTVLRPVFPAVVAVVLPVAITLVLVVKVPARAAVLLPVWAVLVLLRVLDLVSIYVLIAAKH